MKRLEKPVFLMLLLLLPIRVMSEPITIDRIVAVVNNDIITWHELTSSLAPYMIQFGVSPSMLQTPEQQEAFVKRVLDDLIVTKLILQEAGKVDMAISDREVDAWIRQIHTQRGLTEEEFRLAIEKQGVRWDDYRNFISENLLKYRVIRMRVAAQVQISDEQVDRVFAERYPNGVTEVEIDVSHIFIRIPTGADLQVKKKCRARIQEALDRLDASEPFETVAKDLSEGPSAIRGGRIGRFRFASLDPTFAEVAFSLTPGTYSDIVETKLGFHIILVSERVEVPVGDVEETRETLRRELQEEEANRRVDIWIEELKEGAYIDIRL